MQPRIFFLVATACGLAFVMLLCYHEESAIQMPLKLITVRDDNPAAPAPVFEMLHEMQREIAALKRKSWSEHLDPQVNTLRNRRKLIDYVISGIRDAGDRMWRARVPSYASKAVI
jgi:hypothetical protein